MKTRSIGVAFDWRGATLASISRLASVSDKNGYDYFWIPEAWGTDAVVASANVLSLTSRIKVATGVLNIYSRSAALIGMSCLSLMQLGQERFALGLGTSGRALVENWHGVPYESPIIRTREYVEVIRKVVRGEQIDYSGKILKLRNFRAFTTAPSNCNLEIYLGALGDRNIRLAGEICDGAIVTFYPRSRIRHALEVLNESVGKPQRNLFWMVPTMLLGSHNDYETEQRSRNEMAKLIAFYVTSMGDYYSSLLEKCGFGSTVAAIKESYGRGDKQGASKAVSEELLNELCLLGTKSELKNTIEDLPEGVTPVMSANISDEGRLESFQKTLLAVAPERS
jgi:alkanesulfonate monooxygenase SsuD/methylene tetrahydromethanopterin reductase-like flavin-dependent oxidoreductase (luciferase family)